MKFFLASTALLLFIALNFVNIDSSPADHSGHVNASIQMER